MEHRGKRARTFFPTSPGEFYRDISMKSFISRGTKRIVNPRCVLRNY